jgi:hypothetical protein
MEPAGWTRAGGNRRILARPAAQEGLRSNLAVVERDY